MLKTNIAIIEDIIGYHFNNKALLEQAYTLQSYEQEYSGSTCNKMLAQLGNAEIYAFSTQLAFDQFMNVSTAGLQSKKTVEFLSGWRRNFSDSDFLAQLIDKLNLVNPDYFRIGKSQSKSKTLNQPDVKANLAEAIVGAVALDCQLASEAIINFLVKFILTTMMTL
ncbi:MAG: hypothetical protein LBE09_00200 [Christensenellaceae bacterium]|jgi:ribonuclease-3|nr:hypothetical protein [Christensenellaceae bacterium]